MSGADVINIVIGVAVVALVVYRQWITRPVRERSAARLVLLLAVIGIVEMVQAAKGHHLGPATFGAIAFGLAIGAGLGLARAASTRVWRDQAGVAWRRGSLLSAGL